jgi:phage terminase large subunit-like protein
LKAAFAIPMTEEELVVFGELAGGRDPPTRRVRELYVVAGRRSGKDSIASMLAANAAAIEQNHLGRLRPGELAHVLCIACDRDQAKIVEGYTRSFFTEIDDLRRMVVRETRSGIELNNRVAISIATNSFRQARGRTVLLAILDECAFYRDESSASPDVEVYRALTPSLATVPGSMLVAISSPYKRSGLLYDKWKAHFGKASDNVLCWREITLPMNARMATAAPPLIKRHARRTASPLLIALSLTAP